MTLGRLLLHRFVSVLLGNVQRQPCLRDAVHPDRMRDNLNRSRGVVFSGTVLLELARRGASRENAYDWVQRNAMRAMAESREFKDLLLADSDIARVLTAQEIDRAFDLGQQLRYVDAVFERVFEGVGRSVDKGGARAAQSVTN